MAVMLKMKWAPALPAPPSARPGPEDGPLGQWKSARVTDVGRPLGRQFVVGERVYYRDGDEGWKHLLKPGPGRPVRRWMSETQLDDTTDTHAPDVEQRQQTRLTAQWDALEPKHAGFHPGTRIPRRYKGLDVLIVANNPEVRPAGWQADTVAKAGAPPYMAMVFERDFWAPLGAKGRLPSMEQRERDIAESLEHELVELAEKGRRVDERYPCISDGDRARCLDEQEGPAHAYTVAAVDGFYGPGGEERYLRESYYPMLRRWGFGKEADEMERTDL
jgi:hypothetical protein